MRMFLLALFVAAASAATFAPYYTAQDPIKNRYLVKLKDSFKPAEVLKQLPLTTAVKRTFETVFVGFAVEHIGSVTALTQLPFVEYVEDDSIMKADVEWGCDRLDQKNLPLDGVMNIYGTGAGANIYDTDTGVRYTHQEFGGRAVYFWDFDDANQGVDCHGHGTHTSGTAGGSTVGVAVDSIIQGVRVLNCAGAGLTSNIVAGLDAIAQTGPRPGVCSMSLGGGASPSLDQGVRDLIAAGVPTSVSAGNDNADACNQSPARVAEAETVGSTTSSDARSGFSNYGTCVDIFAGGSNVRSSYHEADDSYTTMSGTSMSCPHVSGAIAIHLASGRCTDGASCKAKLETDSTKGVISNPGAGSPNNLLYVENL